MRYLKILTIIMAVMMMASPVFAAFGEDLEKPKPEFTREQDKITGKLIPRAKSTSITIDFEVLGGKIKEISPIDFATANRPGIETKDFRSELFMLEITDVKSGGEVSVSLSSSFFSSSTQLWVFNEKLKDAWMSGDAQNMLLANRVRQLVMQVKDGGAFDADGKADGKVILIVGPRDSFWGYAIGTLFIRFFGIFIVLGVLMIGMIISGKVFQALEAKPLKVAKKVESAPVAPEKRSQPVEDEISPEIAAVIATALHAKITEMQSSKPLDLTPSSLSGWGNHGRQQIMAERSKTFNR